MVGSGKHEDDGRFTLRDLNLTAAERATVRDFIDAWSEHGRPVLFVGAGMSRHNAVLKASAPPGTTIKDWSGLISSLKQTLSGGDESISRRLPSDYLRIAQLHETQFQRARLLDAVENALASRHFEPGPAHQRLKRFPWEAIVTTNYDSLIERTFEHRLDRQVLKVVWDQDLTCRRPADGLLLIKMHGDLAVRDSIVLTEEDYRCYEQGRPGVALKVKQLLLEHPSIFIGFSLSDPNVAAIEGWIRDTTGRLKLPSIVLVHTEPLIAERDMWARRGIQLIHIRPEESLERFFDAVHGERSPRRTTRGMARRENAETRALEDLVNGKAAGWEAEAARMLARLAESANDSDFSDAAHRTLLGGFHSLKLESIKTVLSGLDVPSRRNVFLRSHKSGIPAIVGVDRERFDLEQELVADVGLSPEEKAGVLSRRATRLERLGDLQSAKESLLEARALSASGATRDQIQRRLRDVLLRIGDDSAIAAELLDTPLPEEAFAYAQRGSVALMTRGREVALRWYTEALNAARTGDEKTAALFGLQASIDPGDWSRIGEWDEEKMAILPSERPRVENVGELERKAGDFLLRSYQKGSKSSGSEVAQAIAELREALVEVDDMGWPKCPGPNHTTAADGIAYAVVGLSLGENAPVEQVKEGLTVIVERGLMSLDRHVSRMVLDRILADAALSEWVRRLLEPRPEALYMRRSRSLLRSALLPVLSDEAITKHVTDSVTVDDLKRSTLVRESTKTESHLSLLLRHFRALPREAAFHIVGLVTQVLTDPELHASARESWLALPLSEWVKTGILTADSAPLAALVASLEGAFRRGANITDSFERRARLSLLDELHHAQVLPDAARSTFQSLLDAEIGQGLGTSKAESYALLELARMRALLGPWSPPESVRDIFVGTYKQVRNSTVACTWMNTIELFAPFLTEPARKTVAACVDEYIHATLQERGHLLGPFPTWAATAVHQATKAQIFSAAESHSRLMTLVHRFPECTPFALGLEGVDTTEAEDVLLRALAHGTGDEEALLTWCNWWPEGTIGSERLESALLGHLFSRDPEVRQNAYWSLAILAKKASLSAKTLRMFADVTTSFGVNDPHSGPRLAAVVATARMLNHLDPARVETIYRDASVDRSAAVRRASGLLDRELHGELRRQEA